MRLSLATLLLNYSVLLHLGGAGASGGGDLEGKMQVGDVSIMYVCGGGRARCACASWHFLPHTTPASALDSAPASAPAPSL